MDKLSVDNKNQMKDQNEPQVRNPSFRWQQGPLVPQVMPMGQRKPNKQQIRPPFQENMVDEEFIEKPQDHIHHFGKNVPKESKTFLTKGEHDSFVSQEDDEGLVEEECKDYQKSYLNSMMYLQKQYNLRRINIVVDPPKKSLERQALASLPAKNMPRREVLQHKPAEKYLPKDSPFKEKSLLKESIPKEKDLQKEDVKKDLIIVERPTPPFILQNEI